MFGVGVPTELPLPRIHGHIILGISGKNVLTQYFSRTVSRAPPTSAHIGRYAPSTRVAHEHGMSSIEIEIEIVYNIPTNWTGYRPSIT
jgi:hypothetical protein